MGLNIGRWSTLFSDPLLAASGQWKLQLRGGYTNYIRGAMPPSLYGVVSMLELSKGIPVKEDGKGPQNDANVRDQRPFCNILKVGLQAV